MVFVCPVSLLMTLILIVRASVIEMHGKVVDSVCVDGLNPREKTAA